MISISIKLDTKLLANYSLSIESTSPGEFSYDIEIEFELTLLTY